MAVFTGARGGDSPRRAGRSSLSGHDAWQRFGRSTLFVVGFVELGFVGVGLRGAFGGAFGGGVQPLGGARLERRRPRRCPGRSGAEPGCSCAASAGRSASRGGARPLRGRDVRLEAELHDVPRHHRQGGWSPGRCAASARFDGSRLAAERRRRTHSADPEERARLDAGLRTPAQRNHRRARRAGAHAEQRPGCFLVVAPSRGAAPLRGGRRAAAVPSAHRIVRRAPTGTSHAPAWTSAASGESPTAPGGSSARFRKPGGPAGQRSAARPSVRRRVYGTRRWAALASKAAPGP